MTVLARTPDMTREQFFGWAEAQDARYEFDGFGPVAMTGGTFNHSRITANLHRALGSRLRGTGCRNAGPDAGLATVGDAVRYPDALITCARVPGDALIVPDVMIVFEVLSRTSGRVDRIVKLREYQAVPSIRRYVIAESTSAALTVLSRPAADQDWTAAVLTGEDVLHLPEVGIEVPVAELYEDVDLAEDGAEAVAP